MLWFGAWIILLIMIIRGNIAYRTGDHERSCYFMLGSIGVALMLNWDSARLLEVSNNAIFLIVSAKLGIMAYLWANRNVQIEDIYKIYRLIFFIVMLTGIIATTAGVPIEVPTR